MTAHIAAQWSTYNNDAPHNEDEYLTYHFGALSLINILHGIAKRLMALGNDPDSMRSDYSALENEITDYFLCRDGGEPVLHADNPMYLARRWAQIGEEHPEDLTDAFYGGAAAVLRVMVLEHLRGSRTVEGLCAVMDEIMLEIGKVMKDAAIENGMV